MLHAKPQVPLRGSTVLLPAHALCRLISCGESQLRRLHQSVTSWKMHAPPAMHGACPGLLQTLSRVKAGCEFCGPVA